MVKSNEEAYCFLCKEGQLLLLVQTYTDSITDQEIYP